jgi:hypothetical protein
MSTTDDRADKKLPVTGEVGSEGGSYADPTYQISQFEGDLGRVAENAEPDAGGETDTEDMIKHPSEPPR